MSYPEGREERREVRRWLGLGIGTWVVIVVIAAVLSAGGWALKVALSDIKGQGDAVAMNNSAENWTEAQAGFEEDYAEVIATDDKIGNAYESMQADPSDQTAQDTYNGLVSYCLSVVADYNAAARSYLSADWRAADLPEQIKTDGEFADTETDCKEDTQ